MPEPQKAKSDALKRTLTHEKILTLFTHFSRKNNARTNYGTKYMNSGLYNMYIVHCTMHNVQHALLFLLYQITIYITSKRYYHYDRQLYEQRALVINVCAVTLECPNISVSTVTARVSLNVHHLRNIQSHNYYHYNSTA